MYVLQSVTCAIENHILTLYQGSDLWAAFIKGLRDLSHVYSERAQDVGPGASDKCSAREHELFRELTDAGTKIFLSHI